MIRKHKRIVDRDVGCLFSIGAFIVNPTPEELKRQGFLRPTVRVNGHMRFLSEKAIAALERLTDVMLRIPSLAGIVSRNEIYREILKTYSEWLDGLLQQTSDQSVDTELFVGAITNELLGLVKNYQFLARIEGIALPDQDVLQLGSTRILHANAVALDDVKFGENLDFASVYEHFKNGLWMICIVKGSPDVAADQFEMRATLTIGILAVAGAILYKGVIWRTRARVVISPLEHRAGTAVLRWDIGGDNPTLNLNWGQEQDLPIKAEAVAYLNQHCFLAQLCSLLERTDRTEIQDAIVRSLYWFADAYRDRNPTMQLIKLWSCAESFFAFGDEQITERNARGIAVLITFALTFNPVEDYAKLKTRLKYLYALRSKAIHRGHFDHVEISDLNDLSRWIAWTIVSMMSLSERGFETMGRVHEEIEKIDQRANSGTISLGG